jgi:hypothetical protein
LSSFWTNKNLHEYFSFPEKLEFLLRAVHAYFIPRIILYSRYTTGFDPTIAIAVKNTPRNKSPSSSFWKKSISKKTLA